MEIFNVISGVCSIVGLIVSLFVASKVSKMVKSNNDNKGELQCGDGNQKIAKEKAAFADNHSSATYNDYSNATINGEIDEYPTLLEDEYPVVIKDAVKYSKEVADDTCDLILPSNSNTMCFVTDFSSLISKPEQSKWIGYGIKSLPMRDWRSFVDDDYALQFDYLATGTIQEIQIELANKHTNQKIYQSSLKLGHEEQKFVLRLSEYKDIIDDWKFVDEICFVFFPEKCIGKQGSVFISNLTIKKTQRG